MTLAEALAAVEQAFTATGAKRAELLDTARTSAPKFYQGLFRRGFSTGQKEAKADDADADGDGKDGKDGKRSRADLEADVDRLTRELETATKAAAEKPDVAKLRAEHTAAVDELKRKHRDELQAEKRKSAEKDAERDARDLQLALMGAGFRERAARLTTLDPEVRKRLRRNADGTLSLLDRDGTPLDMADTSAAWKSLAEDLASGADPEDLAARTSPGGGASNGGAAGSGTSNDGYDPVKAGKDAATAQKATAVNNALAFQ